MFKRTNVQSARQTSYTLRTCALLGALPSFAQSETVVKILHLQTNPKIIAIWKDATQTYEKAHPGVKIEFNYLENEAFKAKLPTLLQSKGRPSAFHSWGGGVMYEQVGSDILPGYHSIR
jgi:raffinose/stachyose/melibiose transport system substrate-binding protein